MKKSYLFIQTLDILVKIILAFIILFICYLIGNFINDFAYHYFIFPLVSFVTIFVCGINVGRSLEKMKRNEPIGFFTRGLKNNEEVVGKTEFEIKDNVKITTNKKVLKEFKDGDSVHLKIFNYNDIEENEGD